MCRSGVGVRTASQGDQEAQDTVCWAKRSPVISVAFAYTKKRYGHQDEEEQGHPILVMKDRRSKMSFASMIVKAGGKDEFAVMRTVKDKLA